MGEALHTTFKIPGERHGRKLFVKGCKFYKVSIQEEISLFLNSDSKGLGTITLIMRLPGINLV